jgi:integrase
MLADKMIPTLPLPTGDRRQIVYSDHRPGDDPNQTCRGFGVKVMASGTKTYVVAYRFKGREREFIIGAVAAMKVAAARTRAVAARQMAKDGRDPQGERVAEREAPTVRDLAARYIEQHLPKKRPASQRDDRAMLGRIILPALGSHKVADLRYADIEALHRRVTKSGATTRANRVVALLSKMLSLAIRWEMIATNPAKGIERNPEAKRQRYLKPAEIVRLSAALSALKSQSAANALRLALLTGARIGEVSASRWDQFDLDAGTWTKESSDTKQKKLHHVPLSAPALQLLVEMRAKAKGPNVFPGRNGDGHITTLKTSWNHVRKAAQFDEPTRINDLRHSFASVLASSGKANLLLIGRLLGHSNPSTTNRYAHLFLDPLRAATETAGAVIMGKESAEVAKLRNGKPS